MNLPSEFQTTRHVIYCTAIVLLNVFPPIKLSVEILELGVTAAVSHKRM